MDNIEKKADYLPGYAYPATREARLLGVSRFLERVARAHEQVAAELRPGKELARQLALARSARRVAALRKQDALVASVRS